MRFNNCIMLKELNENNFNDYTKSGLRLIEFYADWCGYCKKQHPVLQELGEGNIEIGIVNADENPQITIKNGITGFPAFLLFKDGKIIARINGFHDKPKLLAELTRYM